MKGSLPISRANLGRRRIKAILIMTFAMALFSFWMRYLDDNLYNSRWYSGYVLCISIVCLAAFQWRKMLPFLPKLGSASGWMQFHIYLGISTFLMFGWHLHGTIPNGTFEQFLAAAYLTVAISGVVGLYWTRMIPRRLAQLNRQFIFERIPALQFDLRKRAHELVFKSGEVNEILARVYVNQVAKFLESRHSQLFALTPSTAHCRRLIVDLVSLDRYMSPSQRDSTRQLMGLIREKNDMDLHSAWQGRLKTWLFVHIAMTYSLITMTVVHVVMVHAFGGGWR